jgi:hypothetical protein
MTSFIANTHSEEEPEQISNNGFFPDVNLASFRSVMRVDQTVSTERITQTLYNAMISVNQELQEWQIDTQVGTLSDVPSESYGDKTKLQRLYQTALFNHAKALLVEHYRDFDSTKSGHERADEMDHRIDDYLRISRTAIRKILGISRVTVELI